MTSDKSYDVSQRVDALVAAAGFGPWTQWSSFSNAWAVRLPFTHAWARAAPGNMVLVSAWLTTGGGATNNADGAVIGTIPATDADGNPLRPVQIISFPVATDILKLPAANSEGAYFQVNTSGQVLAYGIAGTAVQAGTSGAWYPLDSM